MNANSERIIIYAIIENHEVTRGDNPPPSLRLTICHPSLLENLFHNAEYIFQYQYLIFKKYFKNSMQ
jgi:hypothetical protein